uniref:Uncharacterized protein n=1 Tax=Sphaerodactylus townsendi TaxID=933632 RepID=A0ACB8F7C0_9SAUR
MFWPAVLFCGFLSLSVGEGCMEGALRVDKAKVEEIVSVTLGAGIAEKVMVLLKQSDGKKSGSQSASSSSRKTCTIEQPPKVHISKGPGNDMIAMVEITMIVTIEDAAVVVQRTVVEIQKNCNLTIAVSSDGLIVKDCHCSPSDGNVTMSLQAGLTVPKAATGNK